MKPGGISADPFLDRMERALDVMSRRQQLVASNIGNVDTPGFRTQDIDFQSALARAVKATGRELPLRQTAPGHLAGGPHGRSPEVAHRVADLAMRNDGNDVNVDREMMALAETRGRFDMTANVARLRIRQLMAAIEDGRTA